MRIPRVSACTRLACALLLGVVALGARAEPLLVGVEKLTYLPYYNGAGESFEGFGRDLLDAFAADTGRVFEYRALPVKRLVDDFVDGRVDLKFPDNEYWSSEVKGKTAIVYSHPVAGFIDGVSVATDRVGKVELKSVAMPRGFTPLGLQARIEGGQTELAEVSDLEQGIRMALSHRVDGVYGNVLVVQWQLSHQMQQSGALLFDATLPYTRDGYKLSSIKDPALIHEFDAWLESHAMIVATLRAKWQITF